MPSSVVARHTLLETKRGGFGWGGVEGWGEKAYNCNRITIKIFKKRNKAENNCLRI